MHIMVLVNGCILTFAAFSTVQLFVGKVLKEDYLQAGIHARSQASDKITDFENARQDYVSAFEIHGRNQNSGESIPSVTVTSTRLFDTIFWIPASNPDQAVELKGKSFDVSLNTPVTNFDREIVNAILKQSKNEKSKFLFFSPKSNSRMESGGAIVQTRPFAIVQAIQDKTGITTGYLAVFSNIETVLGQENILSGNYVSKSVFWENNTRTILFYLEDTTTEAYKIGTSFKYDFEIVINGKPIKVQAIFKKSSNNLLELLSWLVAGFGLIVTIIILFNVSSHYKKSRTLSKVNADLAEKNNELNDQIRERERLFQTLRKSERENFAIINAISDAIFEVSPLGEILFLNEAWERITGFDIETSLGGNLFDMIFPADREEQKQNIALLAKGQKTAYRELTKLRTIEGTFRSVDMVVSMLRQDEAKNLRIMGSFTDVEERQRAEKALSEAEAKYKTIWENAAGGIYQLTPQGQLLSANPALARIFGYPGTEDMMNNIRNGHEELFAEPQARIQFLKSLIHSSDSEFYESQALRRNGDKIWVRENVRAVKDNSQNVLYYEGSIEDITQRRESEVQLQDAKVRSDMASRAKSEFLANISHELRTPLNSIIGFSEIIKNEVFGPVEPKSYTEYAGNIYDSGKHLLGIINQIIDISRIDAGERELNESIVDVRKVMNGCLDLSRTKMIQAGLTIIDVIPENLPKMIAEEVAIKQMVLNLLSNAAKFTPHGGRITLSAEIEKPSGNMRISVTDTGVGLSQEQIEKATMPFGLVDGRLDKGVGGVGLGLSLINSLLKLHHGKIEILSQKGIGTTVTLIFPASRIQ